MRTMTLAGAAALALVAGSASAQDVVRIGTEGAYPPWNFTDASGELVGFEMDLAVELCARMEVECEFVAQDWDGIIPALLQGRYDAIMAGMSRTDERREQIAFSNGYADTGASFAAAADSELAGLEDIADIIEALDGAVVGVQVGTIHQNFVEGEIPGADLRFYDTQDLLNLDLAAGRVDAGLADVPAWLAFFETPEGEGYTMFGPVLTGADFPYFGEGVGIGLRQDDTELTAAFNEALCSMANDGSLSALATEWFGYDASMQCPN